MVSDGKRGMVRGLVDFALHRNIAEEMDTQYRELETNPDSALARLNLGILFYTQGKVEDAMRELLMSIECDPSHGRAYRKLGEIYIGLGDYRRAAVYARMAADRGDTKLLAAFERYPRVLDDENHDETLES